MGDIILAIDPANEQSAFCFMDYETYKPIYFAKENNEDMKQHIIDFCKENDVKCCACEMVASYGMAVGRTVFETCVEIGRISEYLSSIGVRTDYIYRKEEKMCICGQMKAKDSNIRQALIDRFALFDFKAGRGTKNNPDWFYGVKADIWASYAVGVTWIDKKKGIYVP